MIWRVIILVGNMVLDWLILVTCEIRKKILLHKPSCRTRELANVKIIRRYKAKRQVSKTFISTKDTPVHFGNCE